MMMKSLAVCVGMIVVMFTYNPRLTGFALLFISPSLFATRFMWNLMQKFNV